MRVLFPNQKYRHPFSPLDPPIKKGQACGQACGHACDQACGQACGHACDQACGQACGQACDQACSQGYLQQSAHATWHQRGTRIFAPGRVLLIRDVFSSILFPIFEDLVSALWKYFSPGDLLDFQKFRKRIDEKNISNQGCKGTEKLVAENRRRESLIKFKETIACPFP